MLFWCFGIDGWPGADYDSGDPGPGYGLCYQAGHQSVLSGSAR
jgi:hypothetical protein